MRTYSYKKSTRQRRLWRAATARYRAKNGESYRARNRLLYRWQRLKRERGITKDEWLALFKSQGKRCAICRTAKPDFTSSRHAGDGWRTDHDHATGYVRGILCHKCNLGIGHLNDDVELLRKAIDYLS